MTIAFVHPHKAFLPEIEAYTRFFARYGINCLTTTPDQLTGIKCDVEWFFMGTDFSLRHQGIYRVHEYASPSVAPIPQTKNWVKKTFSAKPDLRVFQNNWVRETMGFHDDVPFCLRDMGIPEAWLDQPATTPDFDFMYVGDLSSQRKPQLLLDAFTKGDLQQHSLLVLGKDYAALQQQYQYGRPSNIRFEGPVPPGNVSSYILRSRFAINYVPDVEPFNQLTSTKLLEYAACRQRIITTDYPWMRSFQQQYGGNYFYLAPDLSNFTWKNVRAFDYSLPDITSWTWEQQIKKSGVLDYLQRL
jgi:hypothetical protein